MVDVGDKPVTDRIAIARGEIVMKQATFDLIRDGQVKKGDVLTVAQIAGIPSRYVGHMTPLDYDDPTSASGHGVCEFHIDGAWAYFDVRGRYFEKADGRLACAWDLIRDPGLVDRQSETVRAHMDRRYNLDAVRKLYAQRSKRTEGDQQ